MADRADAFADVGRLLERELARFDASRAEAFAPESRRPQVSARELPKAIRDRVTLFARTVRFEIEVPGQHYSGLSNDQLFEILANQGRDFLDNTSVALKQRMQRALLESFAGFPHVPSLAELRAEHTKQVKLFIANERFAKGGGDQSLRPLTARYAAEKRRAGYGARPIGVRTGKLLAAFRRFGVVRYL